MEPPTDVALAAPPAAGLATDRAHRAADADRWLSSLLGDEPGMALVAVGGYGRAELLPGSDLDVLLLHRGQRQVAEVAERVWYPVWDSGTRLDHSVRTVAEARAAAREDSRVLLGLLRARHVAGDPELTAGLRESVLADWRAGVSTRLAGLREACAERAERSGELAFVSEPDLKDAAGGLRDAEVIHALAAAWVADKPGPRLLAAREAILDARHALHAVTGRAGDRLVLQEQDEVARLLSLADADTLLRELAEARRVGYELAAAFRRAERARPAQPPRSRRRRVAPGGGPDRTPLAEGVVAQDGEVVLARAADPAGDPGLVLRAAAAAARAGLPLSPATLTRLASCPPLPVPWPRAARDELVALLGAGRAAVAVWEALDQEGLIGALLPDWDRVRNRPQRNALHTFTVDRHLIETAARAAALTREVSRPDLLLIAALLHDIGKGWPGDHSESGEVVARDTACRMGLNPADAALVSGAVRHHLLLPQAATRRDLDDPRTAAWVAAAVGGRPLLGLLHALSIADAQATGPAAWSEWKAGLIASLVERTEAVLGGEPPPEPLPLRPEQRRLAAGREPAALVTGQEVTITAPDSPGLLWKAAGVLASHRLAVRSANATSLGDMAVTTFTVSHPYGEPPDATLVASDLRRALAGGLDVAERLARRAALEGRDSRHPMVAPPRVTVLDQASESATVIEVRAADGPGLLWRIGRALGECGLDVRAARVETLGAEAVDAFYVLDAAGQRITDPVIHQRVIAAVAAALSP